jgi:hypothetical protein
MFVSQLHGRIAGSCVFGTTEILFGVVDMNREYKYIR